jgi:hypothetical protein
MSCVAICFIENPAARVNQSKCCSFHAENDRVFAHREYGERALPFFAPSFQTQLSAHYPFIGRLPHFRFPSLFGFLLGMKVLLRDAASRYYAGPGLWTSNAAHALNLRQIEHALDLNNQQSLNAVHILLVYEQPPCTLKIGIHGHFCDELALPDGTTHSTDTRLLSAGY